MFNFLKKFFSKKENVIESKKTIKKDKKSSNEFILDTTIGYRKSYKLNLSRFEKDWMVGNGISTFKKGENYQWYGAESVTLDNDDIQLYTKYNPKTFNGDRYEYCVGMITSKRDFGYGLYDMDVELPKGKLLIPSIKIEDSTENELTIFTGETNEEGQYTSFMCGYGENMVSFEIKELGSINIKLLFLEEEISVYVNNKMVFGLLNEGFYGKNIKFMIMNSHRPLIEGTKKGEGSLFTIKDFTFKRKI